ncbi:MAG: DegT/DnrJ/EryC1/StrS family aminotransferase [Pseudomonadota bacterium]
MSQTRVSSPKAAVVPYSRPFFDRRDFQKLVEPLKRGWLAQGPQVARFEQLVAEHVGASHGVATSSHATALRLILLAAGVSPGQKVLLSAFGEPTAANAVELCGAAPVFCDIDLDTFAIDPAQVRPHFTPFSTMLIVSHTCGLTADMATLEDVCRPIRLPVVEDCGGAIGGDRPRGQVGVRGMAACFSFGPADWITTGEGAVIVTDQVVLADVLRLLRGDGARPTEEGHLMAELVLPGHGFSLTDIQGALGTAQLDKLPDMRAERQRLTARYHNLLKPLSWLRSLRPAPRGAGNGWGPYVCLIDINGFTGLDDAGRFRDMLLAELHRAGVNCHQPARAVPGLGYYKRKYHIPLTSFPNSLMADRLALALPLFVGMSADEQERVVWGLTAARDRILAHELKHRHCTLSREAPSEGDIPASVSADQPPQQTGT